MTKFVSGLPQGMRELYTHILKGEDGPPPSPGGGTVEGLHSEFNYPKSKLAPVVTKLCTDRNLGSLWKNAQKTYSNLPHMLGWQRRLFDATLAALYGVPKLGELTPGEREGVYEETAQMCDDLADRLDCLETAPTMWDLLERAELHTAVERFTHLRVERNAPWAEGDLEPGDFLPGLPPTLPSILRRVATNYREEADRAGASTRRKSSHYDYRTCHFAHEMDTFFRETTGKPRRGYTATLAHVLLGVELDTETIRSMTKKPRRR